MIITTLVVKREIKAMACGIVVSEFELKFRYYIHFQANILGKGRNLLIAPAIG